MKSSTDCRPNCASVPVCVDIYMCIYTYMYIYIFFYKVACMRKEQGNLEIFLQELSSEKYILENVVGEGGEMTVGKTKCRVFF